MPFKNVEIPEARQGHPLRYSVTHFNKKGSPAKAGTLAVLISRETAKAAGLASGDEVSLYLGNGEDAGRAMICNDPPDSESCRALTEQGKSLKLSVPHRGEIADAFPDKGKMTPLGFDRDESGQGRLVFTLAN